MSSGELSSGAESAGDSPFLSTLTPSPHARRLAKTVVLASVLVFVAIAPFAKTPLPAVPAFLPVYQSALVVCDLITAILLWGQFRILRSRALLLLASGYLFSALMAIAHALSFPGLFAPGGWLGAGPQTTAWLYFLWHGGLPLFFVAYARSAPTAATARVMASGFRRDVAASVALASACAGVLVLLATVGHPLLPSIMAGDRDASSKVLVAALTWLVAAGALLALWRRRPHSILDLWLMVTLGVWMADVALAAVFNHARYDLGWYAGRIFGLLANGFVLMALLLENGLLHARLAQAHDLLAERNAQLAEASRLKTEFLATMSHELRTPLNAIIGFSEVLHDGLAGELTAGQRQYASDIHASGRHLLALINDVLDLSKIEAGQMSLDLAPTPAAALFEHSASVVRELAARRGVRLRVEVPRELGSLSLDARKTRQILFNLLSNAVKFSAEGTQVTLSAERVSADAPAMWRGAGPTIVHKPPSREAHAGYLHIAVHDHGMGIAPEDAPRLFRMFSQLDASLAREAEGTGLGLALVDRLAQLHGGGLALDSQPAKGSSFHVWLPWREAEPPLPEPARRAPQHAAGRTALVVEDNTHAAELMRLHLQAEGFEVLVAACGREALTLAAARTPAVMILDILLPDMDGWDLLALLKRPDAATARVPVVIVSIVADTHKGFALGASAVLQKPVSREELVAALQDAGVGSHPAPARVLVVDDDPRAVELMATYLAPPAFEVLRAHGGAEGIAAARRERPDLLVLDLMMPQVSGFDVVAALKQSPDTAAIPIVVVTAKVLTPHDKATLHGMVAVVLPKAEFDRTGFLGEVHRAMSGGRP